MDILASLLKTIINFFTAIWDSIKSIFQFLNSAISDFFNFMIHLPELTYAWFTNGLAQFFRDFPVPDFIEGASKAFNSIPPEVVYFANAFRLTEGISIIMSAYILRFIVRRIPFFG